MREEEPYQEIKMLPQIRCHKRTYAELNILIFKVLASFLAGILKLMHHMVNLSNESGQA